MSSFASSLSPSPLRVAWHGRGKLVGGGSRRRRRSTREEFFVVTFFGAAGSRYQEEETNVVRARLSYQRRDVSKSVVEYGRAKRRNMKKSWAANIFANPTFFCNFRTHPRPEEERTPLAIMHFRKSFLTDSSRKKTADTSK